MIVIGQSRFHLVQNMAYENNPNDTITIETVSAMMNNKSLLYGLMHDIKSKGRNSIANIATKWLIPAHLSRLNIFQKHAT